jgi:hypothetical protein
LQTAKRWELQGKSGPWQLLTRTKLSSDGMMEKQAYMRKISYCLAILWMLGSLWGCQSDYDRYVAEELASGVTADSLIFGMRIGQTKKDFYAVCWELNRQKLIHQGTGNRTARFVADKDTLGETSSTKDVLFYGIFDENDIMRGMDMTYSYLAWAPWNRNKQADSLMQVLRHQYVRGYPGNDFIEVEVPGLEHPALVKIDGNRQILMYAKNDKDVVVKIEDLHYKLQDR